MIHTASKLQVFILKIYEKRFYPNQHDFLLINPFNCNRGAYLEVDVLSVYGPGEGDPALVPVQHGRMVTRPLGGQCRSNAPGQCTLYI